ncbi:uncharacterized protein NPIL_459081 [Nephila pilipes]|uniref:Uncharacterized protein n=1 Tax=Nephila pilipes TaxID=299642 RepID=A0A8X6TWX5_NEPPI|nr:uncharacterized protein NPIL_459081 [Nephila pilipes]
MYSNVYIFQSGIVKGFYIPTLTIHKEITNTTEIHEKFGHHIHLFCNGSDVSYVTRESQLSRKKRATPNNGEGGQFTHHSYGHYGHQSNNYAHYGHETHVTGTVDKDGNLRGQRVSQHETRSQGSQTYPPSGNGRTQQSQSTDSRSSSGGPLQLIPSSLQNNLGTGNGGQFSLQTAQESGYQLNLPFGLRAGNAYRGGIHSQGQYGVGGKHPQIQTSFQRYPSGQITDSSRREDASQRGGYQTGVSQPGTHLRPDISTSQHIGGRQVPSGLSQTGFPSISGEERRVYGVTDQERGVDSLGQPGLTTGFRPGIDGLQTGRQHGEQISRDMRPGSSIYTHPVGPGGQSPVDVSGRPITGISQPSLSRVPGFSPGGHQIHPSLDLSGRPISGISQPSLTRVPGSLPGFIPGGQQIHPSLDVSGRPITGISQPSLSRVPGSLPGLTPGGQAIYPTLDESGRTITGIGQPSLSRIPGSLPGFTHPGSVIPGFQNGHRDVSQPGIFDGKRITGQELTPDRGLTTDSRLVPEQQRPISSGYLPGSYPIGPPGSISSRPSGVQVDQFGRVTPGMPGSLISPDRRVSEGRLTQTGISPQDIRGSIIPSGPGSVPGYIDGRGPGTIGGIPGGDFDTSRGIRGPDGSLITPGTVSGVQPSDGRSRPEYRIPSGLTDTQSYVPGSSLPGLQYPGYLPSREQGGIYSGLTQPQIADTLVSRDGLPVTGDSRITEAGRSTQFGIEGVLPSQVQPVSAIRFGGGDSASSQTQIQTGLEGTAAEASSAGQYRGLGSQTQVQGGYRGNGSFSAQAQSGFTGGVSQSQVQGGKQGGLSGSSAIVEDVGSAQSQVQIGQPSGAASSSAQGRFSRGMTQVQAQTSKSGGSAGAESQSSGLSNSQVQVNIGGEDGQQSNDFQGTVSASVHGGHSSGQSQTQLQGGYRSGRTYVATAQGGFDSNQGFQGAVPATGSLPILTPPGTIPSQQQIGQPSSIRVTGSEDTSGIVRFPGSLTDRGIYGQDDRITADGRQITSPTAGRYSPDQRPGQIPDSRQTSTFPGSQQPTVGRGIDQSGISSLDQRGLQQPIPSYPGSSETRYQPGSQIPGHIYPSSVSQPGLLQPGHDSRYPDSSGRPVMPDSRFLPGQSIVTPSRVSTGQLPQETYQPGYQPGLTQQPSQIMTGIPSSVQISPPHPGARQPGYQPGLAQHPSQISTGFPSPLQISPQHPGALQPGYQPGLAQPPSQISTGFPSPLQISPQHPGALQPGYQPGLAQPPSQISTGFPSSLQISPPHPGARQPGYQPGLAQPPSHISTEFPSPMPISPQYPGLRQPGFQPGLAQPPSQVSTGFPSHLQILPPHPGARQPGYQPGLTQPPSQISTGFPSPLQISPPHPGSRQPGFQPGSAGIPSMMHVLPSSPETHQPGYQPGLIPESPGIPSMIHPGVQQPSYQPGLLQPPSQIHTGIPSSLPGQQQFPYRPDTHGRVPTIDTSRPVILNASMPRIPTRPPGVREPDLTDEGSCCEALRNLKRRCCDRSNGQNGKSDCCSKSSKFDNDFDLDDDSDESTNGEPCKVVKAVCYIVYKPVGKARICKPTKTNGC